MHEARLLVVGAVCLLLSSGGALAGESGRIEGRVVAADGAGVGGVVAVLDPPGLAEMTDRAGAFVFSGVSPGTYALTLTLGDETVVISTVRVEPGEVVRIEETVDWELSYAETLTVYAASRRRERIVEAPAAITSLSISEIELAAPVGQIPKMLEFTVGAEVTQNGLYDFNFNTRGFNMTLTRRVQVLIDGRDPSIPLVSSQEWSAAGLLTEDLASVELVRGPTAALYGANSFNGVLNLVTQSPRDSPGGRFLLSAGEPDTLRAGLRWAGHLGDEWYMKLLGEHLESDDFTRSRNERVEYDGLALEAVPLSATRLGFDSAMIRLDKYLSTGSTLAIEGGYSDGGGVTFLSGVGRTQAPQIERLWTRVNLNTRRWNVLGYTNSRYGPGQRTLSSGSGVSLDSDNYKVEIQANQDFLGDRLRVVGGLSWGEERLDSSGPDGVQTLFAEPIDADEQAVFAQLDLDLSERMRLVAAARWDGSSLYADQISPKAALVFGVSPNHSLRLSYNAAFQFGTYAELFLDVPAGLPLDLSGIEALFGPLLGDTSLGFEMVPLLGLGNPDLEVEQIRSVELGYRGTFDKFFLTVDFFDNEMKDFITDILPGVNPAWGPWRAPAELSPEVASAIEATVNGVAPGLTNDPVTGAPLFVLSIGNTGRVDSRGLELALSAAVSDNWQVDFNYAWFDFAIRDTRPGTTVNANGPEHKANLSVSYKTRRFSGALRYRWVDEFEWGSGVFVGTVPSYSVVDLSASLSIDDRWQLGLNVSNLLNDEHYELFGGDIIRRRALGYVAIRW